MLPNEPTQPRKTPKDDIESQMQHAVASGDFDAVHRMLHLGDKISPEQLKTAFQMSREYKVSASVAKTPHGKIAFANALAAGKFDAAHQMLTPKLRDELPPERLKTEYVSMYGYVEGETAADHVEVMNVMEYWPAKEPRDIGWAYVSINGPDPAGGVWCEGIAVVVTDVDGPAIDP